MVVVDIVIVVDVPVTDVVVWVVVVDVTEVVLVVVFVVVVRVVVVVATSQSPPSHPNSHVHAYESTPSMHTPLFLHGLDTQSSMSISQLPPL